MRINKAAKCIVLFVAFALTALGARSQSGAIQEGFSIIGHVQTKSQMTVEKLICGDDYNFLKSPILTSKSGEFEISSDQILWAQMMPGEYSLILKGKNGIPAVIKLALDFDCKEQRYKTNGFSKKLSIDSPNPESALLVFWGDGEIEEYAAGTKPSHQYEQGNYRVCTLYRVKTTQKNDKLNKRASESLASGLVQKMDSIPSQLAPMKNTGLF